MEKQICACACHLLNSGEFKTREPCGKCDCKYCDHCGKHIQRNLYKTHRVNFMSRGITDWISRK